MPVAASCNPVIGLLPMSPGVGSLRGGTTSQSWQPTERRAITNAQDKVPALEILWLELGGCGRMAQNPRSIVKKKLRFGGYGARSTNRLTFWVPKLLTSGSEPQ